MEFKFKPQRSVKYRVIKNLCAPDKSNIMQYNTVPFFLASPPTGVPRGGFEGFKPPPKKKNYSEVLTKPSRIPSSVKNTS
jgi:hypothetical protein